MLRTQKTRSPKLFRSHWTADTEPVDEKSGKLSLQPPKRQHNNRTNADNSVASIFIPSLLSRGCPNITAVSVPHFQPAGRLPFAGATCFRCEVSDSVEGGWGRGEGKEGRGKKQMLAFANVATVSC